MVLGKLIPHLRSGLKVQPLCSALLSPNSVPFAGAEQTRALCALTIPWVDEISPTSDFHWRAGVLLLWEVAVAGRGQGIAVPHYFRGSDHRAQTIWSTFPGHGEAICSNSYNE